MAVEYTMRKDHADRWAVIDPETDAPVELDDVLQDNLSEADARVVLELLNSGNTGIVGTSPEAAR